MTNAKSADLRKYLVPKIDETNTRVGGPLHQKTVQPQTEESDVLRPIIAILSLTLAACGGLDDFDNFLGAGEDGGEDGQVIDPPGGTTSTGAFLTISGEAEPDGESCAVCPAWEPDPELSYQTPSALSMGVLAVELMLAADDPAPVTVFAANEPMNVDLFAGTEFVNIDIGAIPEGTYSHLRVTLAYSRYTVDAVGHAPPYGSFAGDLSVDYALSDYADAQQGPRAQGDYLAELDLGFTAIPQAGSQPIAYPPSYPGASTDTSAGLYRETFAAPQGPIQIDHAAAESVDVEVVYFVEDAFGWRDLDVAGNSEGVLDISTDLTATETPASLGVRGFSMTVHQ